MDLPLNVCWVWLNVWLFRSCAERVGSGLGGLLSLTETFVLDSWKVSNSWLFIVWLLVTSIIEVGRTEEWDTGDPFVCLNSSLVGIVVHLSLQFVYVGEEESLTVNHWLSEQIHRSETNSDQLHKVNLIFLWSDSRCGVKVNFGSDGLFLMWMYSSVLVITSSSLSSSAWEYL